MCLSTVWTDSEMNEWLEGQGEVIEAWKGVKVCKKSYCIYEFSPKSGQPYPSGNGFAERTIIKTMRSRYWSGYHWFVSLQDWESYFRNANKNTVQHIKCLIHKDWVTAIGVDNFHGKKTILITSQAIFPHYPETEARYEDIEPFLEKKEPILVKPQPSKLIP